MLRQDDCNGVMSDMELSSRHILQNQEQGDDTKPTEDNDRSPLAGVSNRQDDIVGMNNGGDQHGPRKAAYIVAVNPINDLRFTALWSQLECFTPQDKIDTIVISAPGWSREERYLKIFLLKALETIPHLKQTELVLQYHMNDRYDVGLWCDAAKKTYMNGASILNMHDDFIVTNDSIMATAENYSGILDVLRDENLNMTSLNYSFQRGAPRVGSIFPNRCVFERPDKMWLESALRAFNHEGMNTFLNHTCVPRDHPYFCPNLRNRKRRKRCVVESMEIRIASLYKNDQVKGLFPADAPVEMANEGAMWHSNYKFWEYLYRTHKFPVIKTTSKILMAGARENAKEIFPTCTKLLDDSFLQPIRRRRLEHPSSPH